MLIETGDFHVSTIGDNLPNENEIREKYGTKNFLFIGSSHAIDRRSGAEVDPQSSPPRPKMSLAAKYGEEADDLLPRCTK